jgi:hypothetical protein
MHWPVRLAQMARAACWGAFLATVALGQEPPDTNYDESKVPPYALPDPLVCFDGRPVRDITQWREVRRPEILQAFATHVYGRTPNIRVRPRYTVTETDPRGLGGLATRRQITIGLFEEPNAPWIDLLLYLPNAAPRPSPAFLGLSYGNQGVHSDPGIRPSRDTTPQRGEHAHRWPIEMILRRGYAVATFAGADLEQDRHGSGSRMRPEGWRTGVRGYWLERSGDKELEDDAWGSLGAWAWGLSRALDYLETDPAVDAKRVAVFGHSRTGKTALWAAAQDERFAIAISNNSGQGGASLARRRYGETVAASWALSGIWYCRNYRQFGDHESALPVDQHLLLASIAPRPAYVASAVEDRWADPRGEFLAARHAEPVYRLFGLAGVGVDDLPPVDRPVGASVGYHLRAGDHDITPFDWLQYLDFADRHFDRAPKAEARARAKLEVSPRPGSDTAGLNVHSPWLPSDTLDFRTCEGVLAGDRDFGLFQIKLALTSDGPQPGWSAREGGLAYAWTYPPGITVQFHGQTEEDSLTVEYAVHNQTTNALDRVQIHACITTTEAPSFFPAATLTPAAQAGGPVSTNYRGLYERLFLWRSNEPFSFASAPLASRELHLAFLRSGEAPIHWAWWVNAPETFDLPLIAARSRDGRCLIGLAFERAIWASSKVGDDRACFHLFPSFGRIEPGGSATIRGRLYLVRGSLPELQARATRDLAAGFRPARLVQP